MTANQNTSRKQFGAYQAADVKPFDDSDFDYGSAPALPANRADVLKSFGVTSQEGNGEALPGKAKLVGSEPAKHLPRAAKAGKATSSAEPDLQPPRADVAIRPKAEPATPGPTPPLPQRTVAKAAKPAPSRRAPLQPEAPDRPAPKTAKPVTPPANPTRPGDGYRPSRRPAPEPVAAPPGQPPRKPPTAPPAPGPQPEQPAQQPVSHAPQPVERRPQASSGPPTTALPGSETRGGFTFPTRQAPTRQTRRVAESDRAAKPEAHGTYGHPSLSFPGSEERRESHEPTQARRSAQPTPAADSGVREAHQRISGLENEVSDLRSQIEQPKPRPKKNRGRRRMVAREGKWVDLDG
jgi:hypothetical protein